MKLGGNALDERQQLALVDHHVHFIDDQNHRHIRRQHLQHLLVALVIVPRFEYEQHHIHVAHAVGHHAVHAAIERIHVLGLETGRVHEYKLALFIGQNAGDAVARGLCLARGNADFLPDQMIEQRGLAHVRASYDGDEAAVKWSIVAHDFELSCK